MAAEQNIRIMWEKKEITHRDLIGSPGYVKRVMMNILSNAVKYNRENGQIYISCMEIPSEQPEMTTMEFVCRDTGIGMAEEFQKHIFEAFERERTSTITHIEGSGIGMGITKKLVELMVAGNDNDLPIVFGCPVPKRVFRIIVISDISDVSGQHKNITHRFQRIFF